jgi:hypothetical protein
MTEMSKLPPLVRAKRYRELAQESRIQAAHSKGEQQAAFIKFAGQWEQLAREAEAETEWETALAVGDPG